MKCKYTKLVQKVSNGIWHNSMNGRHTLIADCMNSRIKCFNLTAIDWETYFPSKFHESNKHVFFFFPATRSGLHKLREVGKPFPRKWQENEKMKRKWREREKIERKWRGREKMERERENGERMGKWRERYFLPL